MGRDWRRGFGSGDTKQTGRINTVICYSTNKRSWCIHMIIWLWRPTAKIFYEYGFTYNQIFFITNLYINLHYIRLYIIAYKFSCIFFFLFISCISKYRVACSSFCMGWQLYITIFYFGSFRIRLLLYFYFLYFLYLICLYTQGI